MSTAILEARGLTVRFGGLTALSDVSFRIGQGQIVGLIGPNGAGKTTLFNALVGLVRLSDGDIRLRGHALGQVRPHRIARQGMTKTFQNTALFPDMTLRENVMTAAVVHSSTQQARVLADQCLERVRLSDAADESVANLTFPQKALGEVARALATRPKVLLLDEVMAALTPMAMDDVMATIRILRDTEGITFVVVEHHMRAIMRLCERVLVLNFGKLLADGSPGHVSSHPEVIKAYLGDGDAAH